jgi:hypothetical protein
MNILKDYWHILTAIVFVVFTFTTVQVRQDAIASRIDRLESMQKDIQDIKEKVIRIDERVEIIKQGR